jgi:hypothetical protein
VLISARQYNIQTVRVVLEIIGEIGRNHAPLTHQPLTGETLWEHKLIRLPTMLNCKRDVLLQQIILRGRKEGLR